MSSTIHRHARSRRSAYGSQPEADRHENAVVENDDGVGNPPSTGRDRLLGVVARLLGCIRIREDHRVRWFGRPRVIAHLQPIGRPLCPRDLLRLHPCTERTEVEVIALRLHPSRQTDDDSLVSAVLVSGRGPGLLGRLAWRILHPFGGPLMLPPTLVPTELLDRFVRGG